MSLSQEAAPDPQGTKPGFFSTLERKVSPRSHPPAAGTWAWPCSQSTQGKGSTGDTIATAPQQRPLGQSQGANEHHICIYLLLMDLGSQ